jgi:hypothetical protein
MRSYHEWLKQPSLKRHSRASAAGHPKLSLTTASGQRHRVSEGPHTPLARGSILHSSPIDTTSTALSARVATYLSAQPHDQTLDWDYVFNSRVSIHVCFYDDTSCKRQVFLSDWTPRIYNRSEDISSFLRRTTTCSFEEIPTVLCVSFALE